MNVPFYDSVLNCSGNENCTRRLRFVAQNCSLVVQTVGASLFVEVSFIYLFVMVVGLVPVSKIVLI